MVRTHNHPPSVDWHLRSQTKRDLKKANLDNPFGKPKDFQKGVGMSYEPMMQDPAACHTGRIARVLNKAPMLSCNKINLVQTIDSFDSVSKEMMRKDQGESDEDRATQNEVAAMMGRYKVQTAMINDQVFGSFCASWQATVFSTATT